MDFIVFIGTIVIMIFELCERVNERERTSKQYIDIHNYCDFVLLSFDIDYNKLGMWYLRIVAFLECIFFLKKGERVREMEKLAAISEHSVDLRHLLYAMARMKI